MFARRVYMRLKADCVAELTGKIDKEVIPMLRKLEKDFRTKSPL